jgi:hypothetical protein
MEDFTLPNVGARFKKWECCTSILPKYQAHPQTSSQYQNKFKKKKKKEGHSLIAHSLSNCGLRPAVTISHQPARAV